MKVWLANSWWVQSLNLSAEGFSEFVLSVQMIGCFKRDESESKRGCDQLQAWRNWTSREYIKVEHTVNTAGYTHRKISVSVNILTSAKLWTSTAHAVQFFSLWPNVICNNVNWRMDMKCWAKCHKRPTVNHADGSELVPSKIYRNDYY